MASSIGPQGPQVTGARAQDRPAEFGGGFRLAPRNTDNPEMSGGRSSRLVSARSAANPLDAVAQTAAAVAEPRLRADTRAAITGIFRFMSTVDRASNREEKLAAMSARLRNVLAGKNYGPYAGFDRLSATRETQFLQSVGLGRDVLQGPLPTADRAALASAMGSVSGRLGKEVLPNKVAILFSGGSAANQTTALSSVAYWSTIGPFTGKTSSDYASTSGRQAREDLQYAHGLMRKYGLTEIRIAPMPVESQPSITLLHAIASGLTPEIMFGGERKYSGRVNGPLMQAGGYDALLKFDEGNIVNVLEGRARQEMAANDEFAWATRSLIMLSRGRKFLMADRKRFNSYPPEAREKIDRIGRAAEALLPTLSGINGTAYRRTWGVVDKSVKILQEATGELAE